MTNPVLQLKPGREKPVVTGHPWVFSGAVADITGTLESGGLCDIHDNDGKFIARGDAQQKGTIRCRILTRRKEEIDADFFRRRMEYALALRESLLSDDTNACRLINGEGDFLPGLIVDRYAGGLCCQILTAGMDNRRELIFELLGELLSPEFIVERSEGSVRKQEGLENRGGLVTGDLPKQVEIRETGLRYLVDLRHGQKTGFYLDQRENRKLFGTLCEGKRVGVIFGYSGSFGMAAASNGASEVILVDSSAPASELAQENFVLNELDGTPGDIFTVDAFEYLRSDVGEFDVMLLDPPAFAKHRKDIGNATRAYKEINIQAFRRIKHGGMLMTCSCSQHIDGELFRKIVFGAAVDAGRNVAVLKVLGHGPDHPVSLHHREGEYLTSLLLRVS
jgi:23S rRNA (cytosine1962-C5)-methyltransferase